MERTSPLPEADSSRLRPHFIERGVGIAAAVVLSVFVGAVFPDRVAADEITLDLQGYVDVAPADVRVDRVIVVGVAGRVRKLLLTNADPEDVNAPAAALSDAGRMLVGRSTDVDRLFNRSPGIRFSGVFSYSPRGTGLRIRRIE